MKYTENETISQKQLFSQASVSMLGLSLMAVPEFMRFSLKTMIFGLVLTGLFFWVQSIYFVRICRAMPDFAPRLEIGWENCLDLSMYLTCGSVRLCCYV